MFEQAIQIWDFHPFGAVAALSALLAAASIIADRLRARRNRIDAVGFMPWTAMTVFAMMAALVSLALEIKSG